MSICVAGVDVLSEGSLCVMDVLQSRSPSGCGVYNTDNEKRMRNKDSDAQVRMSTKEYSVQIPSLSFIPASHKYPVNQQNALHSPISPSEHRHGTRHMVPFTRIRLDSNPRTMLNAQ
jgi:hypothetical protein